MTDGIKTSDLNEGAGPLVSILGHTDAGGGLTTARVPIATASTQIIAAAGVDDRLDALEDSLSSGVIAEDTWADLVANFGAEANGSRAEVVGPDAGTHTDPVSSATVPNMGDFRKETAGWTYIGPSVRMQIEALLPLATSESITFETLDRSVTLYPGLAPSYDTNGHVALDVDNETGRVACVLTPASMAASEMQANVDPAVVVALGAKGTPSNVRLVKVI